MIGVGGALAAWGLRAATGRPRPIDLVGALAAAVGVAVAAGGAATLLLPGFFEG